MAVWSRIAEWAAVPALLLLAAAAARAAEPPDLRPYVHFRFGYENSFYHYTEPDAGAVGLESPSQEHAFGGSLGVDIGRHWGLELGLDYAKTDLNEASGTKAGDYSTASVLGQVRYRFPLMDGRLVPYVLAGGGMGLGEFSGREDFGFRVHGHDWAPLGVVGAGAEYFFADNLALTLQARYFFGFEPEVVPEGVPQSITADAVGIDAGLRVYFDSLGSGARAKSRAPATDSAERRIYIALRGGEAYFTDTDALPGLHLDRDSGLLGNGALGVNLSRHWGAELAFEYARAQLRSPTLGRVSGYPVGSIEALARFRYPILGDRVSPYLLAGPGLAFGQSGDLDKPAGVTGFSAPTDWTAVAVFGGGVEYFVEDNVAVGIEVKRVMLFDTTVKLGGVPMTLSPDFVSVSAGLRIFF